MMNCKNCQNKLSDFADQVLPERDEKSISEHLQSCADCSEVLHEMKTIVENAATLERRQPPDHLWVNIAAELDARQNGAFKKWIFDLIQDLKIWFERPGFAFKGAAAFALLLLGIFIGRYFLPPPNFDSLNNEERVDFELLNQRAQKYLEKSKLVLTSVAHVEFEAETSVEIDLEKRMSRHLLRESAYLREHLPRRKNERLRRLITRLDMILREIADLRDQEDFESIELIRDGIESNDLILRINLNRLQEELVVPVNLEKGA